MTNPTATRDYFRRGLPAEGMTMPFGVARWASVASIDPTELLVHNKRAHRSAHRTPDATTVCLPTPDALRRMGAGRESTAVLCSVARTTEACFLAPGSPFSRPGTPSASSAVSGSSHKGNGV